MPWFKVDDKFHEHPKVVEARVEGGWSAVGVWLGAGTWCNSHLTDGQVPHSWVALNDAHAEAAALVKAGLWVETDGGFEFKDYMDYQPSKAEVVAKTEARSKAGSRGGQAKRKQTASKTEAFAKPVPVPEPISGDLVRVSRASTTAGRKRERTLQRLTTIEGELA